MKAIEAGQRRVLVATGEGEEYLGYTSLVHALGAESTVPPVPDLHGGRNVFLFRRLSAACRAARVRSCQKFKK